MRMSQFETKFAIEYLQYLAQSRIPTCRMLKEMCLAPRPSRLPAPWASTRRSRRCSSRYGCHAIHFRTRNNIESRNTASKSITPEMVNFSRLWSLMVLPVAWGRPPRPWTRGRPCSASSLRTATSRCTRSWSLLSARWELGLQPRVSLLSFCPVLESFVQFLSFLLKSTSLAFSAPAVVSRRRATSFWVWCQSSPYRRHLNQILTNLTQKLVELKSFDRCTYVHIYMYTVHMYTVHNVHCT